MLARYCVIHESKKLFFFVMSKSFKLWFTGLILLVTCSFCPLKSFATSYPASECGADLITCTPNCCNESISQDNAYCEGTISAPTVIDSGNQIYVTQSRMSENCTEHCGNNEFPQPQPITSTISTSVSYTDSLSFSTTGNVQGRAFFGRLKVSLEACAGTTHGYTTTESNSVSVTLAACRWQSLYSSLVAIKGKKVKCSGAVAPIAQFSCPHGTYTVTGSTSDVTQTMTLNKAVAGSGTSGTLSNGSCPPSPPSL